MTQRQENKAIRLGLALVLLIGLFLASAWATQKADARENRQVQPKQVKAVPVVRQRLYRGWQITGELQSKQRSVLSFQQSGRLMKRWAPLGRLVQTSSPLAELDAEPFLLSSAQAQAQLEEARAGFQLADVQKNRIHLLVSQQAATKEEGDHAEATWQMAKAQLQQAQVFFEERQRQERERWLRAPFTGRITQWLVEEGEHVQAGQGVAMFSGEEALEVTLTLSEQQRLGVALHQELKIESGTDANQLATTAEIVALSPGADASGLYRLEADLKDNETSIDGFPGKRVLVSWEQPSEIQAWRVPFEAVINPTGRRPFLHVIRQNKVVREAVTVERLEEVGVVVRGALTETDQVVTVGHAGLKEDDVVEVRHD
jgi:RND family efflux transporter MFP subunit